MVSQLVSIPLEVSCEGGKKKKKPLKFCAAEQWNNFFPYLNRGLGPLEYARTVWSPASRGLAESFALVCTESI